MDICQCEEEDEEQVVNEAEKKMEESGSTDNFQCVGSFKESEGGGIVCNGSGMCVRYAYSGRYEI